MAEPGGPSLEELAALASRVVERLPGDGLVDVLWERRGPDERLAVAVTAVHDGRAARVSAGGVEDDQLARAAKAASLRARQARAWPAPPLPRPGSGTAPRGPRAVHADPPPSATADGVELTWEAGVARTAVAATTGLAVAEERSHALARLRAAGGDGHAVTVTVAGVVVGPDEVAAAAAEALALTGRGDGAGPFAPRVPARPAEPGAGTVVVLGPEAVGAVLDQVRGAFGVDLALGGGPLAGRHGRAVAAGGVTLADDAGHHGTLPRAYDAEGVPRRAVTLIDRGAAVGQVHDSASAGAGSTGHATRPLTLAPHPDHLVLAGGAAEDVAALVGDVEDGLFVPALGEVVDRTDGGRCQALAGAGRIRSGRLVGRVPPLVVEVRAFEVLAAVDGLTAAQRLLPLRGQCPGGLGAAVVPALRATAGVRPAS